MFLLARRNRDKSLLLTRVDLWMRVHLSRAFHRARSQHKERRQARAQALAHRRRTPDVVLRIPRFSLAFPNLLDRYVIVLFAKVFLVVVLSGVTLYVLADLTDNVDDILDNKPPASVVATYYGYMTLQIFFDIAPILVLVTSLLTFALLSRTNEVTACRALGISLYRLAVPAVVAAGMVAVVSAGLQVEVLPASNQKVAELRDRMKGRAPARTYRRLDRQWLFGRDGEYIYNFLFYDRPTGVMNDLQVFHFGPEHGLTQRVFVDVARWTGESWVLDEGWVRTFDGTLETGYRYFQDPRPSPYTEPPEYYGAEERRPEQMHAGELRRYIREVERRGRAVPELRVALQNKLAFPALSVVMALVALPFAFRLGRRGALYGVGLSLVLGMVLMGVFAIFSKLGEVGTLPPLAAVWGPNVVFAVFSLYLFLGVRT
jgi:LPS export ABC transporter permease LptG